MLFLTSVHSFPLRAKETKFHLKHLSKMDVEGGLVTRYGDLKRYLLTSVIKASARTLPAYAVVHLWVVPSQRDTSYLP